MRGMADRTSLDVPGRRVEFDQRLADPLIAAFSQRCEIGFSDRRRRAAGDQHGAVPNPVFAFEDDIGLGAFGQHRQLDIRNGRIDHHKTAVDPAGYRSTGLYRCSGRGNEAPDEGAGGRGDGGTQCLVVRLTRGGQYVAGQLNVDFV